MRDVGVPKRLQNHNLPICFLTVVTHGEQKVSFLYIFKVFETVDLIF